MRWHYLVGLAFVVSLGQPIRAQDRTVTTPQPVASPSAHYERPLSKEGPYNGRVIVFVHGIFGDADATWRYSANVYWPRLLLSDEAFRDSDIYVASYPSPYLGSTMNIDEVVASLNNRLENDGVFSNHREVVFVCHSLGGLVVQRLLLTFRTYATQVRFIYFFSTPQTGAEIARLASAFSSNPLLRELIPGDENDYLQNLENEWRASNFRIRRFCAYEKKPYKGVLVVGRLSGTRSCDELPIPINEDHIGIVKPDSTSHPSYLALRNAVKRYPQPTKKKSHLPVAGKPPETANHLGATVLSLSVRLDRWAKPRFDSRVAASTSTDGLERLRQREEYDQMAVADYKRRFSREVSSTVAALEKCNVDTGKLRRMAEKITAIEDVELLSTDLKKAAHQIPEGQQECGTGAPREGFGVQDTGEYTLAIGNESSTNYKEDLEKGTGSSMVVIGGLNTFKVYIRDGVFCVDARTYGAFQRSLIEVVCNRVRTAVLPAGWDTNYTDKAIEVVNGSGVPMLQMMFESPTKVVVFGVFLDKDNDLIIDTPQGATKIKATKELPPDVSLKPLFRYPSYKFLQQYAN